MKRGGYHIRDMNRYEHGYKVRKGIVTSPLLCDYEREFKGGHIGLYGCEKEGEAKP